MVTVRGEGAQENGRPSESALRAKMASMTYSFAQQLPIVQRRVPPKPPPGPGAPVVPPSVPSTTRSEDANFPLLTPPPSARSSGSSSRDPSPASRWGPGNRKTATAAEVVAARRIEPESYSVEDEAATKERAELELYSKLVPTASAVPRNPGRTLGHGGLRSTGSIAAQHRAASRSKSPPVMTGQPPQSMPRKDPSTSRMRSLFSDATKPQLARKVAASSSRPRSVPPAVTHIENATPSGQSSSEESGNGGGRLSSDKVEVMSSNRRTERAKILPSNDVRNDADFANSESRFSTVHPALSRLRDQSGSPEPFSNRSDSDHGRRLHEAFIDSGRKVGGRNSTFHSLRKSNGFSGRRSSASSLGPLSAQVANGSSGAPEGNGVSSGQTDYVPANGFSNRSKGFVRSKMTNEKAESMASTFSKDGYKANFADRDLARPSMAPTNSRAEALRNAIQSNSRKSNGSSRMDSRKSASNQSIGRDGGTQATSSAPTSSGFSKTMARRSAPSLPSLESVKTPESTSSGVSRAGGLQSREQSQTKPISLNVTSLWPNDSARTTPTVAENNLSQQQIEDTSCSSSTEKATIRPDFTMSPRDLIDEDFPSGKSTFLDRPSRSADVPSSNVRGSSPFDGLLGPEKGSAPGPASLITSGFHPMPGTAIQRVPDAQEQKFAKPLFMDNMHVAGSRPWFVNDDRVNNVSTEELAQQVTEFNLREARPHQVQPSGFSHDYRTAVGSGRNMGESDSVVSMIDVLKNWQTQQGISANPTDVIEDAVLPPLPDSNDHGRFESFLRQMGYNSDDEGDGPMRPEASSNLSAQTRHSTGESTRYYSHFS